MGAYVPMSGYSPYDMTALPRTMDSLSIAAAAVDRSQSALGLQQSIAIQQQHNQPFLIELLQELRKTKVRSSI
jgi:hypothetical protein